jgi:diguanylate cyclase (GGDEF)-like protein/hemerythrin-like metal-binding protein
MRGLGGTRLLAACLVASAALLAPVAPAAPVILPDAGSGPIGAHADILVERGTRLSLADAQASHAAGKFTPSEDIIPSFGLGAPPMWLRIPVSNPAAVPLTRQLRIENAWLDEIEIHFVRDGRPAAQFRLGDSRPHRERPSRGRFFGVEHDFAPGLTEIFVRVDTPDPLVLPVFLLDDAQDIERRSVAYYTYGFIYGYLVALLAYNLAVYAGSRDRRYLHYAVFVGSFLLMNAAYTGHGFAYLWPNQPGVQRWIIPILMVAFGATGLAFARAFLDTPAVLPRATRVLQAATGLFVLALAAAVAMGKNQLAALIVAFVFVIFFSAAMLGLAIAAFGARVPFAGYFLVASTASMIGTVITALSVWGWIAHEYWRFRAVEVGMLIDATLLAVALGSRFRSLQVEKAIADYARSELTDANVKLSETLREVERLASTDRLTGLWNRLHLESVATAEMARAMRYKHPTSLLLFDADHFKRINDTYGHHAGDEVLVELAHLARAHLRESDVVTRWGGEEFLVLMPSTSLADATSAAEKLRKTVDEHVFPRVPHVTVSIGVAEWRRDEEGLEAWIARTDRALYRAKAAGRNRSVADDGAASAPTAETPLLQLAWSERYECGHAEIDRQHRGLFEGANAILALLPELANGAKAARALESALHQTDRLLALLDEHFATEEAALSVLGWPRFEEHRAEHQRLLLRARELHYELRVVTAGPAASKLLDFLAREIVAGHIVGADREYAAYVRRPVREKAG